MNKKKGLSRNYLMNTVFALLIIYLLALFVLTLTPLPLTNGGQIKLNLVPFLSVLQLFTPNVSNPTYSALLIVLNVMLFVPLGFLYTLYANIKRTFTFKKVILLGFLLSFFIEVFQLIFATGRVTDVDDIIANLLGALLGCFIMKLCLFIFQSKSSLPRNQ